jgi:adenylate kinase
MQKDIILFGMQGSGKWTQADLLLKKMRHYQYFEPGNIFRALKSNDNVIWAHIRERMDRGEMLDDAITFGVFDISCHLLKKGECFMTDGFLRTLPQMYYFLSRAYHQKRDFVGIYYHISKKTAIKRLMKRAQLEWRKDDSPEWIAKRIAIYEKETLPVIKYFESIGKLVLIDAEQSIERIYKETMVKLSKIT